jgi:B12-binding domain/radical SAM domain protein
MKIALAFYYARSNRFSINALAGALEMRPGLRALDLSFPTEPAELHRGIRAAARSHDRVVVGLSFATPQYAAMRGMISDLRSRYPDIAILAGGPHPTADPASCLRAGCDLAVCGEGEETLAAVLGEMQSGGRARGLPGTAYLDAAGRCLRMRARSSIDLDAYPPFAIRNGKYGPIEITRGCPYGCGFCQTSKLFGRRPRHRKPEVVAHYAAQMVRIGMFDLRVVSPDAFAYGSRDGREVDLAAVRELLARVREAQGPGGRLFFGSMPSEVRPEHVSAQALRLVREYAANDNLTIGAQSGSQRILDACGRGHSVADITRAAALALKAGFKANLDFIFGLPGETEADLARTLALMQRLALMGARIHAHGFMPLPQTRFAGRTPTRLPERMRKALDHMSAAGVLFGQWRTQQGHAARMAGPAGKESI